VEMIGKFISFDTTSRNGNLPLIDFVRDHAESCGAETYRWTARIGIPILSRWLCGMEIFMAGAPWT
jgi:hypothetical protein